MRITTIRISIYQKIFALLFTCMILTACSLGGISGGTIVDHNFSELDDSALASAAAVNLYLEHASVGGNILDGLNALHSADSSYDNSNFTFYARGNPGWQAKIDGLYDNITGSTPAASDYDAIMMKFCFIDDDASFTYYRDRMLQLEALYPDTVFVWWTMPIETTASDAGNSFNEQVREYCLANNKVLFDIAAIESHWPDGTAETDDSGKEIMYAPYSSDGGHLNATGAERVARAFWYLAYIISRM